MSNEVSFNKEWHRWEGEPVPGECDYIGCYDQIVRGPSYACEEPDCECGMFFCYTHQGYIHDDNTCEPKEDEIEFLRTILESKAWSHIRSALPYLMKEYEEIVYD